MFLKIIYLTTFAIWLTSFIVIATIGADFSTQVPMCMGSTVVIFGIATLIVKRYEKLNKELEATAKSKQPQEQQ